MMSTMATSSTQSNFSSSYLAPPRTWNYDVFLSFRGEDTRKNFTDHLYHALTRAGIRTFRDDDQLPRGKHIPFQLMKAIEESRISIIVFSKNYASSRWCLNELVKVLECKNMRGQLVLPVFYDVDPSHVRKQTGSFEKAFAGYEEEEKEEGFGFEIKKRKQTGSFEKALGYGCEIKKRKQTGSFEKAFAGYEEEKEEGFGCEIKKWRAALTEAANLSGWDLQNVANGHESKFIKKIVQKVQDEVNQTYMNVAMHPVGIESRVASINSLLNFEYNDVRIVGIYGLGGIGKSTIAKAVYNQSYLRFEGCSFIANVREVSKQPNGLIHIQEQILSETLKEKNFKVGNVDRGMVLMKERLRSKKVLIVLDDVDEWSQLYALVGENDWFGPKSRIIITTRDKHLMHQAKVHGRYEVDKLNDKESLELFNLHAFKTTTSPDDYLELSKGIIAYFGGLPLALEVFGAHLVGRPREQWESALKRLQQIPDNQIQNQLKISFDGLDDDVKGIFLHIACFFIGMENNLARIILNNCGFYSEIGINVLRERCLLKVEGMNNELIMHNLVRVMGRAIVHEESPKNPGMRSRLWFHEDVDYVLKNDKGTEAIEGISLVLSNPKETKISSTSFARINNLQLLKMHNVNVTGSLEHLSNQLRWLCWHHYPLKCIHAIFHMEKLVVLDMQYSKLNTIWKGSKFLKSLKILNLSHSNLLKGTLDFNGVPMLETLLLEGCTSLLEVHSSIGVLVRLAHLNLEGCKELRNLPDSICMLKSLGYLNLTGCSNLDKLPENMGLLKNLTSLYIDGCNKREPVNNSWFSSIASRVTLKRSPDPTRFLPNSVSSLQCLTELRARDCNISDGDIPVDIGRLSSLKILDLGSNIFCFLPDGLSLLSKLERLLVDNCNSLQSFPKLPPNLESVNMANCTSVERLPDLSDGEGFISFNLDNCISLAERHNMLTFNNLSLLLIHRSSNLVKNFMDSLSQVDTEHAGLPGPIRNKNISSPLFDIPATMEKKRTCSILFDIPSIAEKKDYVEFVVFAAYEAKTDGSVSTRISEVLDPHNASRYQCRRSCLSHFESRNRGNYYLKSIIILEKEIVGGERIEVCFEIAPSAYIVVKMCQLQLDYVTRTGDVSVVNIHGRKIGFDLVEMSSGLADKDYDSKSSSIIWEDDVRNEEYNEYIHLYHPFCSNQLFIGSWDINIYHFKKFLESM
ncbi:hypothetical protein LguiA_030246 [Lonicera macranthoides]